MQSLISMRLLERDNSVLMDLSFKTMLNSFKLNSSIQDLKNQRIGAGETPYMAKVFLHKKSCNHVHLNAP